MWGVTFPYEQTRRQRGPGLFPAEFDALMTRLNERVFERLEEVRDAAAADEGLRVSAADGDAARRADAVGDRRLRRRASSTARSCCAASTSPAARRKARRSIGCSAASAARFGAADAVMAPRGPGQGVLRRAPAQAGDDRRIGPGRRQPAARAAQGVGAARRLRRRRAWWPRPACRGAVGQLRAQSRVTSSRSATDDRRLRADRAVTPASPLDAIVRAARRDPRRRRRRPTGIATTTSLAMRWGLYQGRVDRQLGARRLRARTRQHPAAAFRARRSSARMIQYADGSREAVRLPQGLPDARGAGAPGQGVPPDARRRRVEAGGGGAASAGPALVAAFQRRCSRTPARCGRCRSTRRWSPRRAAASARTSMPADPVRRHQARPTSTRPGRGCGSISVAGLDVDRVFRRRSGVPLSTPVPTPLHARRLQADHDEGRAELLKEFCEGRLGLGRQRGRVARQRRGARRRR